MEVKYITKEEAINMLPQKDSIHTFRQFGRVLLGSVYSKNDIIKIIELGNPQLSGKCGTERNHGLCILQDSDYLLIETKNES